MASRELVGRPLVPFFDSDDNVNDSLQFAEGDDEREEMDVDARVWDKSLGYFVYPEQQSTGNRESRTDSGSKLLLTPSMMLSTSAPEQTNSMSANGRSRTSTAAIDGSTRSNSAKRGSRQQKNRPNTPVRKQNGKEGGDDNAKTNSKKGRHKGANANSNGTQGNYANLHAQRQLSASGKWAWSAFQSSPEPDQLPMPPFLTKSLSAPAAASTSTPAPPLPPTPPPMQQVSVPTAPPLPPGQPPLPPGQPPLPPGQPPEMMTPPQSSVELSMTQDLRRMLNIGGG
ncbi:hypothetical protein PHYBOEH_011252 [Phytophthora boehmeriae]|uniref:Uncharacterized protein n=1 Tax=Phytophthora boehmeriae TaxID=109152 RepID=A0A8T1WZK6_9STRA|nr:hypothetical protein PHYBOEH_011252 [Phytophthora boehmeriae]